MRRDRFYYTNGDKRGLIVLLILIFVFTCGIFLFNRLGDTEDFESYDENLVEYQAFKRKLLLQDSISNLKINFKKRQSGKDAVRYSIADVTPSFFDPNRDDSVKLVAAGLPPYVARNIVRYRLAGGRFRKPEDLSRIYGMNDEIFSVFSSYIVVDKGEMSSGDTVFVKKIIFRKNIKFDKDTVLDINMADTCLLKKIPGIGSGYAAMIVAYRERLGGYVSVEQLKEIKGLPAGFEKWFKVGDKFVIQKLKVNKFGLDRLRSHPYMNFYRARAIVEYRKKYGDIDNINRLGMLEEFQDGILEKLIPYIEL